MVRDKDLPLPHSPLGNIFCMLCLAYIGYFSCSCFIPCSANGCIYVDNFRLLQVDHYPLHHFTIMIYLLTSLFYQALKNGYLYVANQLTQVSPYPLYYYNIMVYLLALLIICVLKDGY